MADFARPYLQSTVKKKMPVPHDKSSLQKFMRMVKYLHKFIPHLADINKRLRELLEKSVEWHWMKRQQKAYEELPVLKSIMSM